MRPETCFRKGRGETSGDEEKGTEAHGQTGCEPGGGGTHQWRKSHWVRNEQKRGQELKGWEAEEGRSEGWFQESPAAQEVDLSAERWQSESHDLKWRRLISEKFLFPLHGGVCRGHK